MSSLGGASASPRSQRRRAEIVDAASARFARLGYHRVGIDDVAAAVGITGGAIYKHFRGKQDLLAQAIDGALAPFEAAVGGAEDLPEAIAALASASIDQRRVGILLTREVRALDGDRGVEVGRRIDGTRRRVAELLVQRRPELSDLDAELLGDAVLALMCSPAHHSVDLSRQRSIALLGTMALRIADVALPAPSAASGAATPSRARTATLVDRRDQLIDAAVDLFGRRGYWASTMDDLGAAADIAGPSIYQHFDSKADLLVAVFTRGNEGLRLGLSRALAEGQDARDALRLLVESYVDFVLGHPEVNRLLLNEQLYLPELERASVRGMQQRYVAEWVNLLQEAHPGLDQATARFLTHGVLSIVNNRGPVPQTAAPRRHEVLVPVAGDLLLTPGWGEAGP
jgi:AcrR family transcriptional regulator